MGRVVFLRGQPRRYVRTNASRGLSATVEFLVCFSRHSVKTIVPYFVLEISHNMRILIYTFLYFLHYAVIDVHQVIFYFSRCDSSVE